MQILRVFALLLAAASPVRAIDKPAPAPAAAQAAPQGRAFLSFAEADRKAAQDALGWLGFYNGVVDGAYGKRTIEALSAYQQSLGAQPDGILTAKLLAALKEEAGKAKAAVGFKTIDDPATGVRIGAPTKWLEKRASAQGSASLTSKDGAIGLYLKESKGDIAALYKSLSADSAERKVTYKYLKAGAFFVTAGEEGDNKFYRRYAADGDRLRGFAFVYPKKRAKALDPVALALANSFEPFPAAPQPPAASLTPAPSPTPAPPKLAATALIVARGVAVTTLTESQCKAPTIDGKPVRFLEGAAGLSRLGGDFGANAEPPPLGQPDDDLVALALTPAGPARTSLRVATARLAPGKGETNVIAALGPAASGAPLFDRRGRLVAFVAPIEAAKARAGVALAQPHATVSASGLGEGGARPPADAPMSAAEIAFRMRGAVVGIFCAPPAAL